MSATDPSLERVIRAPQSAINAFLNEGGGITIEEIDPLESPARISLRIQDITPLIRALTSLRKEAKNTTY